MNAGASWAQRQGLHYRRLCARPGCGAPAVTTLRFQPTLRQAWLVDLDETAARTQGDLCYRHAEALVLPRGWELHDQRTDRGGRRAEEPAPARDGAPATRRVRVRPRAAANGTPENAPSQLPGFEPVTTNGHGTPEEVVEPAAVEPDAVEPDAVEPDAVTARVIPAQFGANDVDDGDDDEALNAILDARTPLLQRAFRNSKPGA